MENYKAFRTQTELLMERRTTAISQQFHSPLMLAQQEMELLKKKVRRQSSDSIWDDPHPFSSISSSVILKLTTAACIVFLGGTTR